MKIESSFSYQKLDNESELNEEQKSLLDHARSFLLNSYSPYSGFKVSASLLLENSKIVNGTNQENMAYPSGLCAERVAVFSAKSNFPNQRILKIAITASSEKVDTDHPITPCGACRQVLLEYELNQKEPIELILCGSSGEVILIDQIKELLPLYFFEKQLKE